MGFSKSATAVFLSLTSMLMLGACAPGIKLKETKQSVQTASVEGTNFTVTFDSLRVSSLNGYSAEGTLKFVLTDVTTGESRLVSEFVHGTKQGNTIEDFPAQGNEPKMSYTARCSSMTCDRFEVVVLFASFNSQTNQPMGIAMGIIQEPTYLKKDFVNFGAEGTSFEQVIAVVEASEAQ